MDTVDRMIHALGPSQALREVGSGRRLLAAVGRWRHSGARVDLSGTQTFQLVFNVSGGQSVELQWRERSVCHLVRAGSIGIVSPGNPASVAVTGRADILQIFITSDLIETVTGSPAPSTPPQLTAREPELQAAAAQALVSLARDRSETAAELDMIVRTIACRFAQPVVVSSTIPQGGLSPAARRRVYALISERLYDCSRSPPTLGELAAAAGVSVYHFVRAFRRTEGDTPYARVIARRLDRSLSLLLRADARVDQVGEVAGFSSPSHFVSTFRKRMGVTPGALRDAAQFRI